MDERLQFVARRLAGEAMAELCREFGVSRKTGYKIFDRYQDCGVEGLTDRSRRPYRYANKLPFQVENFILNVKREHTGWGARKIRERLIRRSSGIPIPAKSTIHAVLDRHGLVERRGRLRRRAQGTALSLGQRPNELWCTDYKHLLRILAGDHCVVQPNVLVFVPVNAGVTQAGILIAVELVGRIVH
jgi:transposase